MLSEMAPHELGEWIADYSISPWGDWREDFRAAQIAAILAESNRNRKSHPEPFKVSDFMFDYIKKQSETKAGSDGFQERLKDALRAAGAAFKRKVKK